MNRFQRIALTAFITVEVLIFVGAAVRATGSGLGCPDWPFCYGRVIPPTSADQIDFTKLNLEKFKARAARHGRDPAAITPESIRAEFDPVATWIEYINRLTSIPVGISVTVLLFASFRQRRASVIVGSVASFLLVGINAWLGARVVLSGLKPGTITLHMALAILLLCALVFTAWRGTASPWLLPLRGSRLVVRVAYVLFALIVIEGVMGSQVRELTDHLAMTHSGQSRSTWVVELEQSWVYVVHRSFSWLIVGFGIWFFRASGAACGRTGWLEQGIMALIAAQMVLGVVLSHVGIVRVAQILHIGLSSLLVSGLFLWLLGSTRTRPVVR
jgi:heme a synthase